MFKLPAHVSEHYNAARASEDDRKAVFANLSNADLAASARFWLQHCVQPRRFAPDEPIYDATFWHVIVPELLRRIEREGA
jgi:hypothetical protein